MLMRKTVIILGSSEGKLYAEKLQNLLISRFRNMDMLYDCVIWSDPMVWETGEVTMTSLIDKARELKNNEGFAITLFTPDDVVELREEVQFCSRDNVWLEYGLFVGIMGKSRVFAVCPYEPVEKKGEKKGWRKPSDFQQYAMRYEYKGHFTEIEQTLNNVAIEIADRINCKFPRRSHDAPANEESGPMFDTGLRRH